MSTKYLSNCTLWLCLISYKYRDCDLQGKYKTLCLLGIINEKNSTLFFTI